MQLYSIQSCQHFASGRCVDAVDLAPRASDVWAESSDEKRVEEKGAHDVRVVCVNCIVSCRVNDHRVEGGLGGARNVCVVRV